MKNKNLFILALGIAVIITACKKDNEESFYPDYNDKTVEQNKATLEDNGIQLVGEMDDMTQLQSVKIAANFSQKANSLEFEDNNAAKRALVPIKLLIASSEGSLTSKSATNMLKSIAEDPESLSEGWDMIVGKYTYNFVTETFDKSASSNSVIIEFPGLEEDLTNTAKIVIDEFEYTVLTEPIYDDGSGDAINELPTSLRIKLSYEGDVLSTFDYSAAFEPNGIPTSFIVTFVVETFSYNITLSHDPYSNASIRNTFKHNSETLIETFIEANGDWSQGNIDNNMVTEYDEYGEWEEFYFENVLNNSNAYVRILGVKVAGQVDVKGMATKVRELDNQVMSDQQEVTKIADLLNQYAKLAVINVADNKMIAKAEAYPYYNEDWDEWDVGVNFVFADGSKVDADTYFGEGFSDLFDEINALIEDINAEYDANLEPIEY